MKHRIARVCLVFLSLALLPALSIGCSGEAGLEGLAEGLAPTGPPSTPVINTGIDAAALDLVSISPTEGPPGTAVMFVANNFDYETGTISVGDAEFAVEDATFVIPEEATPGTLLIVLNSDDDRHSGEKLFTVTEAVADLEDDDEEAADEDADADGALDADDGAGSDVRLGRGLCAGARSLKQCLHRHRVKKPKPRGPRPGRCVGGHCPDPAPWNHEDGINPRVRDIREAANPADYRVDPERKDTRARAKRPAERARRQQRRG